MTDPMYYAFIDDSGTIGIPGGTNFLVVSVICTSQPREIKLVVSRALKIFGRSLSRGEIKAADFQESAIERFLKELVRPHVFFVSTIVNQHEIKIPPKEIEELYRKTVARTVFRLVERWPCINICLDQRYTNKRQRFTLEQRIRETIQDLSHESVLIHQENSVSRKELQAAGVVSWAFFQKYERGIDRFYNIIKPIVIKEEIIREEVWSD